MSSRELIGEPLTDIKRTWLAVCKKAGLAKEVEKRTRDGKLVQDKEGKLIIVWKTTIRIHDLRHASASVFTSKGFRCRSSAPYSATHSRRRPPGMPICSMIHCEPRRSVPLLV